MPLSMVIPPGMNERCGHVYFARTRLPGVKNVYKVGCCQLNRLEQHLQELPPPVEIIHVIQVSDRYGAKTRLKQWLGEPQSTDTYLLSPERETDIMRQMSNIELQYPLVQLVPTMAPVMVTPAAEATAISTPAITTSGDDGDWFDVPVWAWIMGTLLLLGFINVGQAPREGNPPTSSQSHELPDQEKPGVIVTRPGLQWANLHPAPNAASPILRQLPNGERVTMIRLSHDSRWRSVRTDDGLTGWVPNDVVKLNRPNR